MNREKDTKTHTHMIKIKYHGKPHLDYMDVIKRLEWTNNSPFQGLWCMGSSNAQYGNILNKISILFRMKVMHGSYQ